MADTTGSLFPERAVDRVALAELAERSIPRAELLARYASGPASSDLHALGYSARHWFIPSVPGSEVIEYASRIKGLPRVTVACWADQAALHRAIGARVVSPGERFA